MEERRKSYMNIYEFSFLKKYIWFTNEFLVKTTDFHLIFPEARSVGTVS